MNFVAKYINTDLKNRSLLHDGSVNDFSSLVVIFIINITFKRKMKLFFLWCSGHMKFSGVIHSQVVLEGP